MIEVTERPLSKEAYMKALEHSWPLWVNYKTGETYIQRQFWRGLPPTQKADIIRLIDGDSSNNDRSE